MKETGLNHQHVIRKERGEGLNIKQIVQFTIFFVVCFWLLYQIYHLLHVRDYGYEDVDKKVRTQRIGKLFGRKGGLRPSDSAEGIKLYAVDYDIENKFKNDRGWQFLGRKGGLELSHNAEGMELYGMDLIGEAERIKHVAEDDEERNVDFSQVSEEEDDESSHTDANEALDLRELGEISAKEGQIREVIQEKKAIMSTRNASRTLISEKDEIVGGRNRAEVVSLVNLGAVILKKDDNNYEVFRFNDETGPPKHDSAPSRRINIQVESSIKGDILRLQNPSNGIESCQKIFLQNSTEKQRLNKYDRKTSDHEERPDSSHLTVAKSGLGSMRELLQRER